MKPKYTFIPLLLTLVSCNKKPNNVQRDALFGGANLFICTKIESPKGMATIVTLNEDLYYALLESKDVASSEDYNSKLKEVVRGNGLLKIGMKAFELLHDDTIKIDSSTDSLIRLGKNELMRRYVTDRSIKSEMPLRIEKQIIYALSRVGQSCYADDPSGRILLKSAEQ